MNKMNKKDIYFQAKRNIKVLIYWIINIIIGYVILITFYIIYKKGIIFIIVVVSIIVVPYLIGSIIGILIRFDRFYYDNDKIFFSNWMGKIRKENLISLYRIEASYRVYYKFCFLKDIDIHLFVLSFGDKGDLINSIKSLADKKRELLNDPDSHIIYKEVFVKEKRL